MKKIAKILSFAVILIIVLLLIVLVLVQNLGGRIVEIAVETAATKTLGVGVDVGKIDLSLVKGRIGIHNLIVKNPAGYTHENLLELASGTITAKPTSLLTDTIEIPQFKLDGINLVIEQKALSNNLNDVIGALPKEEKQTDKPAEPAGKKLHIGELEITNIKVNVKLLPVPGKADTVTLNLAPIRMTDLGGEDKLSTGKLASKILLAIASGIAEQGVGVLPADIVNTMKSTLSQSLNLGKTAVEEGEKVIEKGKDLGTDIIKGFESLLKPKKKE